MISENQKNIIISTLRPYNPVMIGVFGSYARGDQNSSSDMDILVDFEKTVNLLDIIGLEINLSDNLGVKVDLITKKAVSPKVAPFIQQDLQQIL